MFDGSVEVEKRHVKQDGDAVLVLDSNEDLLSTIVCPRTTYMMI